MFGILLGLAHDCRDRLCLSFLKYICSLEPILQERPEDGASVFPKLQHRSDVESMLVYHKAEVVSAVSRHCGSMREGLE